MMHTPTRSSVPEVSIILCTYNRPIMLKKAIRSVQEQTYRNWKLLVVDDGSEKENKKIINAIKDKRISYIYKKNTGTYDSTNLALKKITTDYFCFLDDDDTFLPQKFSDQVTFLNKNPKIDACYADYVVQKNEKETLASLKLVEKRFLNQVLIESKFSNSCFLFRSKLKKELFNTTLQGSEAVIADWLLRLGEKYIIAYSPGEPSVVINRHGNNKTNNLKHMKGLFTTLWHHYKKNKNRFTPEESREIENAINFREGKYYFWNHQYERSRKLFLKLLSDDFANLEPLFFLFFTFFGGEKAFDVCLPMYEIITGKVYIKDAS